MQKTPFPPVGRLLVAEPERTHPNLWRLIPAIFSLSVEVVSEELCKLVNGFLDDPQVVPFLIWIPPEPLVICLHFEPSTYGSHGVYKCRIRGDHIGGYGDIFDVCTFVCLVRVHCLTTTIHLPEVLAATMAPNDLLGYKVEQTIVPSAAANKLFTIKVATRLLRSDCF